MWSTEHAKNYLNYTGYLDFKIKAKYISEPELVQFIQDFRVKINNNEIDYEDYHNFLKQYGQFLNIEKPSLLMLAHDVTE